MKLRGNRLGLGALALALALTGCSKGPLGGSKESDDETESSGTTTAGDGTTSVSMAGSLALTVADEGAALTADAYNLYCVTFTDVPLACKIDVAADGAFSKECTDFASKAFGCFLRQGNKTLATIEFDIGSALTVGGGSLAFNISFDPVTGLAFAKIDKEASTSLGGTAPTGDATTIALDGTWKIGCPPAGDAEIGDCAGEIPPEGFPMTFTTFKVGDADKLSMWGSTARRDVCLAGGSEALPNFRIAFGGTDYKFDYSTKESFEASVDGLFAGLDVSVKEEIVKYSKARGHTDFCSNQPVATDCKIFVPEMVETKIVDQNAPGGIRTEYRPKNYEVTDFDAIVEFTGAATASEWKCAIDPAKQAPGIPPCGGNMQDPDGDGLAGGMNYVGTDNKPLMMLCKMDTKLMQFPVMAATKAEALTAATSTSGGNSDCSKVTYAGATYLKAQVEEIRRATYELFRVEDKGGPDSSSDDPSAMCSRSEVPDGFTFASCGANSQMEVCYLKDRLGEQGLAVVGGKLAASDKPARFDGRTGDLLCPTAAAALKDSTDPNSFQTFSNSCRTELVGLGNLVLQLRALMKGQALYRPMSEGIICGRPAGDALRTKLLETVKNSCMAEVEYNKMCFEGGVCETTMSCRGSTNNGKCMSDDGALFTGRVNGRDEIMDLKMMLGGAFAMSSSSLEKYYRWNQESNKPVSCTFAKTFIINARKVDDNTFNGIVSSGGTQSCEGDESSEGSALTLQDGGGEGGGKDGGGEGGHSMTIPIQAVRQ